MALWQELVQRVGPSQPVIKVLKAGLAQAKSSDFIRHNAVFFTGTLIVSIINYVYYPVLGRLLKPERFGEVQVLVSLFLQIGILFNALNLVSVSIIAHVDNDYRRKRLVSELEYLALLFIGGLTLITIAILPWIKSFLQFDSAWPILILMAILIVGVPANFRNAYLQGKKDFLGLSIGTALLATSKLVASVGLVLAGTQTAGAIGGLLIAQLLALVFLVNRTGFNLERNNFRLRWPDLVSIKNELLYGLLVLVVFLATTILYSFDVIVIKHYFSPLIAGQYAGVASVGRIVFYLTASISAVMFPLIKIGQADHNRRTLRRSLILVLSLGGLTLVGFTVFPRLVIKLFLGAKYMPQAKLLPALGLAIFLTSLVNLYNYYLLALRRAYAAVVAVFGLAIATAMMVVRHHSPEVVVANLLIASLIMLVCLVVLTYRQSGHLGES